MAVRYQDLYPTAPLIRSEDIARPSAAALLRLDYFEIEPGAMPARVYDQHHIVINLAKDPQRVENWRDGEHRDFINHQNGIILTPAGVRTGWRWHAKSRVIVITLEPAGLERFAQQELGLLLKESQLRSLPHFIDEDLTQAALMLLEAINSELGSALMFESLARVFLIKLIQKYGLKCDRGIQFSRRFTARHYKLVLDYVAAHFGETLTLEQMAAQAAISPYHFARLFKQTIGTSPYQFVLDYRIEQAKKLLSDPERSLLDVAETCGFADQPHFSRIFKRFTGVTPNQFRRGL